MRAKDIIIKGINTFGGGYILRRLSRSPKVIFWHGVSPNADPDVEGESFPSDIFEKEILWLRRHYEIISMDEFNRRYKAHSFTNHEALITFDDGYRNNLTVAAPILKKYKLPFTVFISSENIDRQKPFYISIPRLVLVGGHVSGYKSAFLQKSEYVMNSDAERIKSAHEIEYTIKYFLHAKAKKVAQELVESIGLDAYTNLLKKYHNGDLLTWEDVKRLHDEYGCTIGSHCLDHCICHSKQDKDEVKRQIQESKRMIEEKAGCECKYFAYPNGDFTEYSNQLVEGTYEIGFTTKQTPVYEEPSRAAVGRIGAPANFESFKLSIDIGMNRTIRR